MRKAHTVEKKEESKEHREERKYGEKDVSGRENGKIKCCAYTVMLRKKELHGTEA